VRERLCNVGAAEFLLPRERVRTAYEDNGFSISLIETLSQPGHVSRVEACAQLAFCAPHPCIALVCRVLPVRQPMNDALFQADVRWEDQTALVISCAFRSAHSKYSCATGTALPRDHLLTRMTSAPHGEHVRSKAPIPFRNQKRWEVDCESIRLGEQIFAFFHLEEPPVSTKSQLRLW
jgi:hypothetical protein